MLTCMILFLLPFQGVLAQESPQLKSGYGGGYMVVPEGENWLLDRAFISDGEGYSILIGKNNFEKNYAAGDTLRLPYYVAEMELLTKSEMVQYQLSVFIKHQTIQEK